MKRLMVVYNPRSSHYAQVREEVIDKTRDLKGWVVGKYEVEKTNVDDNAAKLAKLLNDGDLVVAAGGDGTATIAANAILLARAQDVKLGVLGYGNFNDLARTLKTKHFEEIIDAVEGRGRGKVTELWALECLVNERHWRFGMCYFTVGLFAEACAVFDQRENRRELRTGQKGFLYSVGLLARWYMRNRKREFLADFRWRGRKFADVTDYVAVNGRKMARVMRGGEWFLGERRFWSEARDLSSVRKLMSLMIPSVLSRIPGEETRGDVLNFAEMREVMIQAEGEYKKFSDVNKIEIRKAERALRVVVGRGA